MGSIISDDMESMMKTNLIAPIKIIDSVIDSMKNNKCGKIVNISSIYGKISKEKRVLYTSTKYGINGLTVGASVELAKFNILVNSVSPGFVLTDLTKKNLTTIEINKLKKVIPIQRLANVEDIVNPIIFLISDYNTYITGQNIIVDGGYTSI
jgi:3-oxoacyl-[acyl-carrier protein] reductase